MRFIGFTKYCLSHFINAHKRHYNIVEIKSLDTSIVNDVIVQLFNVWKNCLKRKQNCINFWFSEFAYIFSKYCF